MSYTEFINVAELIGNEVLIDLDEMGWIVNKKMKLKCELWNANNNYLSDVEYFYGKDCKKKYPLKRLMENFYNYVISFVKNDPKKRKC